MKLPSRLLRLTSGVFLLLALALLILGTTLLADRLVPMSFVIYWLSCFLLAGIAAILALTDMISIRREQRREQQELIAQTVAEAKREASGNDSSKT